MHRRRGLGLSCFVIFLLALGTGCGGVNKADNDGTTGDVVGDLSGRDVGADVSSSDAKVEGDSTAADVGTEDANSLDTSAEDTGTGDKLSIDLAAPDSSVEDIGTGDQLSVDLAAPDSSVKDIGTGDQLSIDLAASDSSTEDVGTGDVVAADVTAQDSSTEDSGATDLQSDLSDGSNDAADDDSTPVDSGDGKHDDEVKEDDSTPVDSSTGDTELDKSDGADVAPTVSASRTPDDTTVPRGSTIQLSAQVNGSGTCSWTNNANINDDPIDGCQISVPALVDATWTVTYTQTNGSVTDTVVVSVSDTCTDQTKNGNETDTDCGGPVVWFNELAPRNFIDRDESGFELAGPAGLDLNGWKVLLWNSFNGTPATLISTYKLGEEKNRVLVGTGGPVGVRYFKLWAGALNLTQVTGLMLVDPFGRVHQFISYLSSITASYTVPGGQAETYTSNAVISNYDTPPGGSFQLTNAYPFEGIFDYTSNYDFIWTFQLPTPDAFTVAQTFGPIQPLNGQNLCTKRCAPDQKCGGMAVSCDWTDGRDFRYQSDSYRHRVCLKQQDVCFDCGNDRVDYSTLNPPNTQTCKWLAVGLNSYTHHYLTYTPGSTQPLTQMSGTFVCGAGSNWTEPYLGVNHATSVTITFPSPVFYVEMEVGRFLNYSGILNVKFDGLPPETNTTLALPFVTPSLVVAVGSQPTKVTMNFLYSDPISSVTLTGQWDSGDLFGLGIGKLRFVTVDCVRGNLDCSPEDEQHCSGQGKNCIAWFSEPLCIEP